MGWIRAAPLVIQRCSQPAISPQANHPYNSHFEPRISQIHAVTETYNSSVCKKAASARTPHTTRSLYKWLSLRCICRDGRRESQCASVNIYHAEAVPAYEASAHTHPPASPCKWLASLAMQVPLRTETVAMRVKKRLGYRVRACI